MPDPSNWKSRCTATCVQVSKVELGSKNRKEVIALVVLGVIGSITTARMFLSSSVPPPVAGQQIASTSTAKPAMQRTASGKFVKVTEPRLDPTLDLDQLRQNEQIKYAGNARNIFVAGSPVPEDNGTTDHRKNKPEPPPVPVVPPPPPIELKFFGFANKPGEAKKIFLSHGEDIFIASEGDIVNRRYRVLHISPASVDIEDVLNNNRQSIPLTQG
jgi:hypothetical protein